MYATDASGWAVLPRKADANEIRIPKGTPSIAAVLRAKYVAGRQTVVLLERGGIFRDLMVHMYPGQPDAPTIYGSFGTGPQRPVIQSDSAFAGSGASWVAFYRLELVGNGKVAGDGIGLMKSTNILIEDCKISGFQNGVTFQSGNGLWMRRNIIARNHGVAPAQRSQGLYIGETTNVLLEDNFFGHNGWLGSGSDTLENHNIYINGACSGVTVKGLISAEASSHGLQMRGGGGLYDYLSINNPIGLSYGLVLGDGPKAVGGVIGTMTGVTIVGGRDIRGQQRGIGIQMGNVQKARMVSVMALDQAGGSWPVIWFDKCQGLGEGNTVGIMDLKITNMMVNGWKGPAAGIPSYMIRGDGKNRTTISPITLTGFEGPAFNAPVASMTQQNFKTPTRPDWNGLIAAHENRSAGDWDASKTALAINTDLWRQS
jgi:hypothetical protein